MFKKESIFNQSIFKKNGMGHRMLGGKNKYTKMGFMNHKIGGYNIRDILEDLTSKKRSNSLEKMG